MLAHQMALESEMVQAEMVEATQFPELSNKYHIMGVSAHPLFHAIREEFGDDATPRWNFHKYLFDRNGQMIGNWPSATPPDDTAITHKIECNLQSWIL